MATDTLPFRNLPNDTKQSASTGTQGSQGVQGAQGSQGVAGSQGAQGSQGQVASQGAQGAQGPAGLPGLSRLSYVYGGNVAADATAGGKYLVLGSTFMFGLSSTLFSGQYTIPNQTLKGVLIGWSILVYNSSANTSLTFDLSYAPAASGYSVISSLSVTGTGTDYQIFEWSTRPLINTGGGTAPQLNCFVKNLGTAGDNPLYFVTIWWAYD